MQLDLTGRHALVCGASQGIGRAIALELAELGASITLLARSADALAAVAATLPTSAGQVHRYVVADTLDTARLASVAIDVAKRSPVHILVNNSGGPPAGPAHTAEPDAYLTAFRQHLIAGQTLVQAVLPGMREAGYGRIVNIISTSVKEPLPNLGVSNTVRAAVASWAKTLSVELAADGITVNNVLPGYTRTARLDAIVANGMRSSGNSQADVERGMLAHVPAGRFADAAEVAAVAAFLCTPAAAYVNGVSIPVDGGRTRSLS
ncbi:3-oxoacyl-[acyl-carrier protein] reductase [Luteibacter rhizovicinus]|uniref:3-oxoacyl-[acyl-carrier protein] reductase n=1 Tax=Luteibacter rhizovicinus TaxID=242606 RepID=A0A4R3YZ24_9GAMM|nr:SDR family oxidoreductase [Luteibacter rhizovicinus]TCV97128.1 3-oxoacyl-[acyl-carrier protein] reductase [Luteibacter rhizovicinus]